MSRPQIASSRSGALLVRQLNNVVISDCRGINLRISRFRTETTSRLQRFSASDSNRRCRKGEWYRLQLPSRRRGPRPILIFAAAKKNSPPAERHYPTAAAIPDFRLRLENRCKDFPVYVLLRAAILDFRLRLGNRCRVLPVYAILCASILDFKARLGDRCSVLAAALRNGPPAGP